MNNPIRRLFDASESNAGAGQTDRPAKELEREAVKKNAGDPGSIENVAGMLHKTGDNEPATEQPGSE